MIKQIMDSIGIEDIIDRLNADYLTGKYSATEYADKLAALSSAQWNAVNAAVNVENAWQQKTC